MTQRSLTIIAFTSILALFNSGTSLAQAPNEILQLKQTLAVMKAELMMVRTQASAIGSIQQAFLSESEFQRQMGSGWVLCDGRAVTGSKWEKIGNGSNIPNCAGRFLRSAGGSAAPLRSLQEFSTSAKGIGATASTSLTSEMTVSVTGTTADASWTGPLATTITDSGSTGTSAYTGLEAWANGKVGNDGIYWSQMFSHNHGFTGSGSAKGGAWSTSLTITGDSETRPSNVTINTFIKIN